MTDPRHRRFERQIDRIQARLPDWMAQRLERLRQPSATWVRVPVGGLLVVGGVFSFLPVLGLWMLPLGLILLSYDIPFLKAPIGRMLVWGERRWREWRRRRRSASSSSS